ncbi:Crp/Fnr family transcriptional regulator [Methylorubrum extorquens]|uniref:Crp/Fnr family transcriptional regulator n=1 Tax=Methylorubrum extorquens TaxID=408 RepID=UPI00223776C7|nr:Crp/Fnr family transcriptional regulator [Methylorubrum extorquens]UYW24760.1 Crp/Fnr family transcriptional regulator [Methylorubrum extorquens]
MSRPHQSATRNRLLKALAAHEFDRLAPHLEAVSIGMRQQLITPDQPISHAYFIEDGLCSLIADSAEGRIEVGLVGCEGFVGAPLMLGADRTPHLAMIQAEGTALRIAALELEAALDASRALRGVLGRYVQSLIVQVGQTVYANADYNVEARLARWILMTHDRLRTDELPMTHESMAMMLGVRRPGVTSATHILEAAGMIKGKRGRVIVLDREKLMELAGDTYGPAEAEYERLLAEAQGCR